MASDYLEPVADLVSDAFQVVLIDPPGCGRSSSSEVPDVSGLVDAIEQVRVFLGTTMTVSTEGVVARAKVLLLAAAGRTPQHRGTVAFAPVFFALTALLVALAACGGSLGRPSAAAEPSVAGIVTQVEPQSGGRFSVTVEGGGRIEIVRDDMVEVGGSSVEAGDLILYGKTDDSTWWAGFGHSTVNSDCLAAYADTAFDEPNAVLLVYEALDGAGIRLAKARDFRFGDTGAPSSGRYDAGPEGSGGALLCLNERGEVTGTW